MFYAELNEVLNTKWVAFISGTIRTFLPFIFVFELSLWHADVVASVTLCALVVIFSDF